MALFKKKELTEEEIAKKKEKRGKIKNAAITVGKVVLGVAGFAAGALLVLAAMGLNTESDQDSDQSSSNDMQVGEDAFVEHVNDLTSEEAT